MVYFYAELLPMWMMAMVMVGVTFKKRSFFYPRARVPPRNGMVNMREALEAGKRSIRQFQSVSFCYEWFDVHRYAADGCSGWAELKSRQNTIPCRSCTP